MAATRASYDAVASGYAEAMSDELRHKPLDRALLTAFGEQVALVGSGRGRVWDVGCGPGHVAAFLAGLGLEAAGLDLSDGMVAQARARYPGLEFRTGSMTALPSGDGEWDGLVSFYALIHLTDDADLGAALAEFRRVLVDQGLLLLAVHVIANPTNVEPNSASWISSPGTKNRYASAVPPAPNRRTACPPGAWSAAARTAPGRGSAAARRR